MTYAEYLAQPKEHRALMLAFESYRGQMQAIEQQEMRQRTRR